MFRKLDEVKIMAKEIKFKKKELSQIYDILWGEADKILKEHNPCQICVTERGIECSHTIRQSVFVGDPLYEKHPNVLCCGKCKYHDLEKGCTVKALGCKVSLCGTAMDLNPETHKKLRIIRDKADSLSLYLSIRSNKEYILKNSFENISNLEQKRIQRRKRWNEILEELKN